MKFKLISKNLLKLVNKNNIFDVKKLIFKGKFDSLSIQEIGFFFIEICLAYKICVLPSVPHVHQANILRYPHNKKITFLQLSMGVRLIFFVLGNN
ncbi:hypothetical protein BAMA_16330 [Bacillus manliponensis]|uniref:Uncharacterized protein n=1 Tax=Bacillus manliponensis TaxID=574376 RepID=A0A073JSP5_9BACI|nr:hypothetical protein BAMA_16330 [Bacillus manliponensis]